VVLGIRPEHIELSPDGAPLQVTLTEHLGGNTVIYGSLGAGQALVVQVVGQSAVRRGDTIQVRLPATHCHVFDSNGLTLTN
jgi:multiple sugar transport system ATP-binding protein